MQLSSPTGRQVVGYLPDDPLPENVIARLKMLRASGRSPGNPKWYKAPTLPKQFVFKAGAKPVYPAQCKPTVQAAPAHVSLPCKGGPFDGQHLAVSASGVRSTLTFSLGGQTGYYERSVKGVKTVSGTELQWFAQ